MLGSGTGEGPRAEVSTFPPPQLTDDVKKEKEKEPEKLDKLENSTAPKKKGFEEEHKDSDDDSSDDEAVRPAPSCWGDEDSWAGWLAERHRARDRGELWRGASPVVAEVWGQLGSLIDTEGFCSKERCLLV